MRSALAASLLLLAALLGPAPKDPKGAAGGHATARSFTAARESVEARLWQSISAREYRASRSGAGAQAPNRAHRLRTWFDATGIRVHDRAAGYGQRVRLGGATR